MKVTRRFYAFLFTVTLLGFECNAGFLPPVSEISYKWIDPFNVKLSWTWERPGNLSKGCEVNYILHGVNKVASNDSAVRITKEKNRNYNYSHLTGETGSGRSEVAIQVVGTQSCHGWKSINKNTTVTTMKPKGQLVKDFKCVVEPRGTNCSWIPVKPDLSMSYGPCENKKENVKRCHQVYSDGMRNGCHLNFLEPDICFLMETESELQTFKAALVIPLPKMSIRDDGERLNLTWTTPEVSDSCNWDYHVCYKESCEKKEHCQTIHIPSGHTEEGLLQIGYNNECRYEFVFNVVSGNYCPGMLSDGQGFMTYGSNRDPVQPLRFTIVIASILSIIMSICLVLTCYCFKSYRAIFCPNVPDPSVMFKEMMASGNKDLKATTSPLYTPMPEVIEPYKLTLVTETASSRKTPDRLLADSP